MSAQADTTELKSLEGCEVSITGRMASVTRPDAVQMIRLLGGSYARSVGVRTSVLIVGDGVGAHPASERPTHSLRLARRLRAQGQDLDIVSETTFIAGLGLREVQGLERLYNTAQLARLLGVPPSRINTWVRQGLLSPAKVVGELTCFTFQQLADARLLHRLITSGIPATRLRRRLEQLRAWCPSVRGSLAPLSVSHDSCDVLVSLEDGCMAEPTGQLRFGFQDPASPTQPRPLSTALTADQWFERGVLSEEGQQWEEAAHAYRQAQALGGHPMEATFNLGNTLYRLGHVAEAARCFQSIVELDPTWAEAWNNLGNTLGDLGHPDLALPAFQRALALAPLYADAHYNLAQTLHLLDRPAEARAHWSSYVALERPRCGPNRPSHLRCEPS